MPHERRTAKTIAEVELAGVIELTKATEKSLANHQARKSDALLIDRKTRELEELKSRGKELSEVVSAEGKKIIEERGEQIDRDFKQSQTAHSMGAAKPPRKN